MPIVNTSTPTVARVAAIGVAVAPDTTQAPRPTSRMSAPSASSLGTTQTRLAARLTHARDDVQGSDEHFARRRILAGQPAHELEWRAIQGCGETFFAAHCRQRPTQRPDC